MNFGSNDYLGGSEIHVKVLSSIRLEASAPVKNILPFGQFSQQGDGTFTK